MTGGQPSGCAEVLATFRRYDGLVDGDTDMIEWRRFSTVLKRLDPAYFTDRVLAALLKQVGSSDVVAGPTMAFRLETLIERIFGPSALDDASAESCTSGAAGEERAQVPLVRVRKVTGDEVLVLRHADLLGLTVAKLRAQVGTALGRRTVEINLVALLRQLEDAEMLEELLPAEGVLEIMLAVQQLPQFDPDAPAIGQLPALKWLLLSPDQQEQLTATRCFRQMLSIEHAPPIDRIIEQGIVPRLLELCEADDFPQLQFEAAWALTNVASGTQEQTRVVVEGGAVPIFVRLLSSASADVREQAVWGIGNIAGDSPALRDLTLGGGALQPILDLLDRQPSLSMLRNATWTLSNLCRGKPQPNLDLLVAALPTLARSIYSNDEDVLIDSAWALSYISDGTNDRIAAVLDAGILPRAVELLQHDSSRVQTPALRIVGNIVTGDDSQTQQVLAVGALPHLRALLNHTKRSIQKESCWAISNITAGNQEQIQAVLDAGMIQPLLQLLRTSPQEVQKEVAWALGNATSGGSLKQIREIVTVGGCIPPMVGALRNFDNKLASVLLGAIENILQAGHREQQAGDLASNPYVALLLEEGAPQRIENLRNAVTEEVREKANRVLAELLGGDSEGIPPLPDEGGDVAAENRDDPQDDQASRATGDGTGSPGPLED
mmetsp:Transcript_142900/g.398124  ORF Transcript_142900/g.398124 Transcript_142900/m.398124 type:complete len:664 (+) Transcript_142900:82-2073(+)